MPRPGGHMGGPGMGGHHRGGPGGFGGGHYGGFRGYGGPPPPPHRGFAGYYGRPRGPRYNPGCLGGCLTFLMGSVGIIALIVLALGAIF